MRFEVWLDMDDRYYIEDRLERRRTTDTFEKAIALLFTFEFERNPGHAEKLDWVRFGV